MKIKKYYQVSAIQLFFMAILTGVIGAAIVTINMMVKDYLLLPQVVMTKEDTCGTVINFKNGEAYTCNDVGVILRNYRKKTDP